MSRLTRAGVVWVVFVLAIGVAEAFATPELVTNGGFETDSFAGWTMGAKLPTQTAYAIWGPPLFTHSGLCSAGFATAGFGYYATISQTIPTVPGESYTFSFWLLSASGQLGLFDAYWGGTQVLAYSGESDPYQQFSFVETATGTATVIELAATNPSGWYFVDDVSVTKEAPEPSSLALLVPGFVALAARSVRKVRI